MSAAEEREVGVEDLLTLIKDVKTNQKKRIQRLVSDFATSFNMTEEEVLKQIFPEIISSISESTSAVQPKYANPQNRKQTWAGRGKTPIWMEPYLEKGHDKDDFLIEMLDENFPETKTAEI